MSDGRFYEVEPWAVRECALDPDRIGQSESVFALANGHIGLRANLDEGEPHDTPGTYLNGFYEERPLPYAETAYGLPDAGQTIVNVTNGKLIRLLVDDEQFDVRYGDLLRHERALDLREGVLTREVEWRAPTGREVRVRSTRLVSFVHRSVAAIEYVVEAVDADTRITIQSELVANEPVPMRGEDPRAAAALAEPLVSEQHGHHGLRAGLIHSTRVTRLRMAAAMDHVVEGPQNTVTAVETEPDMARVTITTELKPGERLRVVKLLAYAWSSRRSRPSLRDQADAVLASARRTGWEGLREDQRAYLDDFWERADVELDGDPALQQALRFGLFHTLQAGARAERRAIAAKGLTGPGYDGHTFWDTETFVLPVLTYTAPDAANDALRWRHSVLDLAKERARVLGRAGAAFPWRTIRGQECSGYWPAGTAAFHINADIADAVRRYVKATGDEAFERELGLELLVETARLWRSLGHHDPLGAFRIDGVTGPDEYSAIADNNVFTNLMAARNLTEAADACVRHPDGARALGVEEEEMASWRDAAGAMTIPFDKDLGVHPQSDGFTRHRPWDFAATGPDQYPLMLHFPYYELYRSQVVKQADLVFALYLAGDRFDPEQKARDFAYYEAITVRDSSLSAPVQAIVAAEVGHLELAHAYFTETALIDLRNLAGNTRHGLHIAALASTWLAAVAGFGGLRDHGERLTFAPRLPPGLSRLAFRISYRGRCLRVEVDPDSARYELLSGEPLELAHHGKAFEVAAGRVEELPVPPAPRRPAPSQPPGRQPGVGRRLSSVSDRDLERLAELVRVKNAADAQIARLIGRPCQPGHVGEWIAAAVFDIALHESATTTASDGMFRSGPLAGRSVNVKWYGLEESLLDVHPGEGPDSYLVMTGPRSSAGSSRGQTRPWVISAVYLFEHAALVGDLQTRGLKIGVATSVRRSLWEAAEVHPRPRSPLMVLTDEQRRGLALFAPETGGGGTVPPAHRGGRPA